MARGARAAARKIRAAGRLLLLGLCAAPLAACADDEPDAYGNFEARDVTVSAEVGGRLIRFDANEGDHLPAGTAVGQIDTVAFVLQRQELLAQRRASHTRTAEAEQQIAVLRAQLATAYDEHERTLRLYGVEAATARQLNNTRGEVRVLEERIRAARAQTTTTREEVGAVEARIGQIDEQIAKSRIANPITGTVLTTYVEPGEFAQPGSPLYRIANLDTLVLRAYVSGAQLSLLRLGDTAEVRIDVGADERRALPGRVTWIASEAEFTPTPIQTREERTAQVYAVKIHVPNADGAIKIGMPAEVIFRRTSGDVQARAAAAQASGEDGPVRAATDARPSARR